MDKLFIGLGVVVIIIAGMLALKYFQDNRSGKEEAKRFLKELEEQMYLTIIESLNILDFKSFQNFEEYEKRVLELVYQGCWEFIDKKIAEADNKDLLSTLAKKFLTKEFIEKFIDEVLVEKDVKDTLMNVYGTAAIEEMDLTEENKLTEEFSDEEKYNVEEISEEDLPPAEEPVHTEEEIEALNPQTDDGDDLEEGVEEIKDRIIKITNKAGKAMYYLEDNETGKRKQVSKEYAINSELEIVDRM